MNANVAVVWLYRTDVYGFDMSPIKTQLKADMHKTPLVREVQPSSVISSVAAIQVSCGPSWLLGSMTVS